MMLAQELIPRKKAVPEPLYRLRWRFDFLDKPSCTGVYNACGKETDGAWCVNKQGLVRASIEGENIYSFETKTFFELDGHSYVTAEWEAYSRSPGFFANQEIKPRTYISGLSFLTAVEKITVLVDGTISRRALRKEELGFRNKKEHSI